MNIYERAIKVFGEHMQLVMVMEEAAELTQSCSKLLRGDESNINEEIADMEIMLEQLKHTSFYDQEEVDRFHNLKVERLGRLLADKETENLNIKPEPAIEPVCTACGNGWYPNRLFNACKRCGRIYDKDISLIVEPDNPRASRAHVKEEEVIKPIGGNRVEDKCKSCGRCK